MCVRLKWAIEVAMWCGVRMKINAGVTISKNSDGAFVVNEKSGGCFALNAIGVEIWGMIESGCSADEVVRILNAENPGIGAEKLRADVQGFITALAERELLSE